MYLVGGTMPEAEGNNLYNTCTVYTPTGELLTKYRKVYNKQANADDILDASI